MFWNVDVLSEVDRLRNEMNDLFSGIGRSRGAMTYPLVNVYDGKENIVVSAELPGMTKENVTITFTDGTLTLAGRLEPLASTRNMTPVRQERATGDFEKTVRIPTKVRQEKISASFNNGVLTVTLPKSEEAKPKSIHIETK
jgi:HSP20 family protein